MAPTYWQIALTVSLSLNALVLYRPLRQAKELQSVGYVLGLEKQWEEGLEDIKKWREDALKWHGGLEDWIGDEMDRAYDIGYDKGYDKGYAASRLM